MKMAIRREKHDKYHVLNSFSESGSGSRLFANPDPGFSKPKIAKKFN
jgi:hypothetical protein